ncbi:MAG: ABC transporter substrate-binding protein [Magnetococcus sp. YQC-5]
MLHLGKDKLRLFLLLGIMVAVVAMSTSSTLYVLYQELLNSEKIRLRALAASQVRLINTFYESALQDPTSPPSNDKALIDDLLTRAYQNWHIGLGSTGEIIFARRHGEHIEFLFRQRHAEHIGSFPQRIPWQEKNRAIPIHRALEERSGGVLIGLDYRGVEVLAAYEYIVPLEIGLTIKIDIAELRSLVWTSISKTVILTVVLLLVGGVAFIRIGDVVIQRLYENRLTLHSIFEYASEGIVLMAHNAGTLHMANKHFCQMLGCKEKEVAAIPVGEINPDGRLLQLFADFMAQDHETFFNRNDLLVQRRDNTLFYTDITLSVIVLHKQPYWLILFRDATERRRLHATRIVNEDRLRRMMALNRWAMELSIQDLCDQAIEIAATITNSQIGFLSLLDEDQSTQMLVSTSKNTVQGGDQIRHYLDESNLLAEVIRQMQPVICNNPAEIIAQCGLPREPLPVVRLLSVPVLVQGKVHIVFTVGNKPELYDDSDIHQLLAVGSDVLDFIMRKRWEEKLQRSKEEAESAHAAKAQFLASMSHEIRTPMNGVLGMADLILRTSLTPQQRHYINIIHRSGRTLLRIINDILDLSKIQAGRMILELIHFDLDELIRDLHDLFMSQAQDKGLELSCVISDGVPVHLLGDPYRLNQVLFNLIGNAIKFTGQGSIRVTVDLLEEREADVHLHFQVSDTGIGIAPDLVSHLFQPFSQADSSITRKFGGSGLGLAITRQLVHIMEGELWVESVPDQGSTFAFSLHLGKQQPGDRRELAAWQTVQRPLLLENSRFKGDVLLAEDHPVNQEVAKACLELFGCRVTVVDNGQQVLNLIQDMENRFDIILMDCEMPVLDGFEATRRLRCWEAQTGRPHTTVIALTAHVLPESRQRCRAVGMDDFLHKPFSQINLGCLLQKWLPKIGDVLPEEVSCYAPSPMEAEPVDTMEGPTPIILATSTDEDAPLQTSGSSCETVRQTEQKGNRKTRSHKDHPVSLGLMSPLTGVVRIYGPEISRAGQIAVMEINENGGVLGRPLQLVIEDDGSLPDSAVRAAEKLLEQHQCAALIGNLLSNARIAVAYRVAEPRRIPLLNFSFYEGSILSRYFFHFAALPNQQIDKMIPYMLERYGPRMFFAGNNYEWPRGSINAAKEALLRAGGTVVGEEYLALGVARQQIDDLLDQVSRMQPDVFVPYFAGADQIELLTRFADMGLKNRMAVVMGHYDEMMASHLPPEVRSGHYSSNTYFMTAPTESNQQILRRLAEMPGISGLWPQGNGILTNFGEGTYLCVKAFAQAANQAGSLEPEALIDALKHLVITAPQGTVHMDPATHHARVNTFLSRCDADGRFNLVSSFGAIDPVIPERYGYLRIEARAAREEDIRLQSRVLEHMTEGVCLVRASDGVIVFTNRGFENMFSYDRGELIGKSIAMTHTSDDQHTVHHIIEHLYRKGVWEGDVRNIKKDGTSFWGHVSISTMTHAEHGEVWIGIHKDIDARKRAEEELFRYRDNLEETVRLRTMELATALEAAKAGARAKESFLVNMSHEIRTPMNGVLGMADMMLRTPLTEQQHHYVETIQRSGHTLLRIIDDILNLAKIHAGQMSLETLRFDLDVLMQDIKVMFSQRARSNGLEFRLTMAEGIPVHLVGDPSRLNQVLFNLLENAIKFTEHGSVALSVDVAEERPADVLLCFQVTDTGIGISEDYQGKMFQIFSQEDPSVARRFGGTGLGLPIARQLVILMDGDLWLESAPNQGAKFWFTARFGKQQPGDRQEIATRLQTQTPFSADHFRFEGRLLLVEDNPVNREVAVANLELFGCQVTVAENGHQALAIICAEDRMVDAIFMDCEMPLMDGFETTRRLRIWEEQAGKAQTPVIALTAHVLPESRQQCRAAGMDDYLHKPFSQTDLGGVLYRWLPLAKNTVPGENPFLQPVHCAPVPAEVIREEPPLTVLDQVAVGRILDLARKSGTGLLNRMVEHYLSRTPELLAELEQALEHADSEGVRVAAHTLKSSSLTMGAARLAEIGRAMELECADLASVREYFSKSALLFDEAREALQALCASWPSGDPHE